MRARSWLSSGPGCCVKTGHAREGTRARATGGSRPASGCWLRDWRAGRASLARRRPWRCEARQAGPRAPRSSSRRASAEPRRPAVRWPAAESQRRAWAWIGLIRQKVVNRGLNDARSSVPSREGRKGQVDVREGGLRFGGREEKASSPPGRFKARRSRTAGCPSIVRPRPFPAGALTSWAGACRAKFATGLPAAGRPAVEDAPSRAGARRDDDPTIEIGSACGLLRVARLRGVHDGSTGSRSLDPMCRAATLSLQRQDEQVVDEEYCMARAKRDKKAAGMMGALASRPATLSSG